MRVLALNAGSATLKHAVFALRADGTLAREGGGTADVVGDDLHAAAVRLLEGIAADAVGHRIVHGGPGRSAPEVVDDPARAALGELRDLAPLHLPPQLAVLDAARRAMPRVPHVACFDTAFHRAMPEIAQRLPLPERHWTAGIRRYGFHGLSYASLMRTLGDAAYGRRVLLCHLGNGASMAAVHDGRPVDTTMSFTPAAGLMMGTRTGDLDPGVLLHLARTDGLDADALEALVTRESGLRGVSGGTSDMRGLLARRDHDPAADRAVAMFCRTARRQAGAMVAAMDGVDLIVFSGGIGEHAAPVRAEICDGLGFLGVTLDPARNAGGYGRISADGSGCEVRVVASDEEHEIARQTVARAGRAAPCGDVY